MFYGRLKLSVVTLTNIAICGFIENVRGSTSVYNHFDYDIVILTNGFGILGVFDP